MDHCDDLEWPEPLRRRAVVCAIVALLLVLWLNLYAALFGAMSGYVLHALVRRSLMRKLGHWRRGANALLALALVAGGAFAVYEAFELLLNASAEGLPRLLQLLADTLDHIRATAPAWVADHLPDPANSLQQSVSSWLRSHAGQMQHWGMEALRVVAHLLIGLVIGVMAGVSLQRSPAAAPLPALAVARWRQLVLAFADVLAAQLRIALVNAAVTAAYLLLVLPAFGVHLPLAKTLVALTFFASLLPIVGNLLSNTAIIVASLTVSLWVGIASFVFLVVVHKLEYFLNAHFVGSRVDLPVFALLASMLMLEAAFGVAGLVAAPVYCAWITRELRCNRWIGR